jgi:DNA primase
MAVDIVQEIKQRTDLVELISAYVPLKRAGRNHKGLCPFHSEKTPSFTVDGERGMFKCWGCGTGGDCFTFIQEREGLSFNEAGELLARKAGLEWVRKGDTAEKRSQRERLYDVVALAERFYRQSLEAAPDVRKYVEGRGLTAETCEQFRLGYAPGGYEALLGWLKRQKVPLEEALEADVLVHGEHGVRDRFVERLMFPIFDLEGRPIAFGGRTLRPDGVPKYLNSRETPIFQKGKTLYGLHRAKRAIPEAGFTVAVEGYMDLIALHQAGISNAVAGLGTAITETHVGILRRYSAELVFCYDGDSAGIQAALRNASMFEAAGCNVRVAVLPEGADPDTYIQREGADAFRGLLNQAEPLLDYHLSVLRRRYNLTDDTTRLAFVREAAKVVAQSGSHLTRQEYAGKLTKMLDRLAEEWYPGDPRRAAQARVALTHEVNQRLQIGRMNGRGGPSGVPAPTTAAPVSGLSGMERYVLRAALSEDRWAELVGGWLRPEYFTEPACQEIAARLAGNNEDGLRTAQRTAAVREDPAMAEVASALLLDEAPLSDEGLEQCMHSLEREWKTRQLEALKRAYEAGEFSADDPRREEYLRLRTELGGRSRRED